MCYVHFRLLAVIQAHGSDLLSYIAMLTSQLSLLTYPGAITTCERSVVRLKWGTRSAVVKSMCLATAACYDDVEIFDLDGITVERDVINRGNEVLKFTREVI